MRDIATVTSEYGAIRNTAFHCDLFEPVSLRTIADNNQSGFEFSIKGGKTS